MDYLSGLAETRTHAQIEYHGYLTCSAAALAKTSLRVGRTFGRTAFDIKNLSRTMFIEKNVVFEAWEGQRISFQIWSFERLGMVLGWV